MRKRGTLSSLFVAALQRYSFEAEVIPPSQLPVSTRFRDQCRTGALCSSFVIIHYSSPSSPGHFTADCICSQIIITSHLKVEQAVAYRHFAAVFASATAFVQAVIRFAAAIRDLNFHCLSQLLPSLLHLLDENERHALEQSSLAGEIISCVLHICAYSAHAGCFSAVVFSCWC